MEVQDDHIVEEVDKLREHDRQVHSYIGLYIPSVTYLDLDFSLQVADFAIQGSYSPSWTCVHLGSSHRLLISPLVWKVPIVPHCHVSPRVTLLTVLLSIWVFHFLSIQTTGKQSCS